MNQHILIIFKYLSLKKINIKTSQIPAVFGDGRIHLMLFVHKKYLKINNELFLTF